MLSTFLVWFCDSRVAKVWSLPDGAPKFCAFYNNKLAANEGAHGNRMNVRLKPIGSPSELEDSPCRQRRLCAWH